MSSGQLYWTCTLGQSVRRTYPSLQATTVNQDLHLMRFILATLSEKTLLVSGYFFYSFVYGCDLLCRKWKKLLLYC